MGRRHARPGRPHHSRCSATSTSPASTPRSSCASTAFPDAHSEEAVAEARRLGGVGEGARHEGPHRLSRSHRRHHRRRGCARFRRCDLDRAVAQRPLLARRAHCRCGALRPRGWRARQRRVRARHLGVLSRTRRAHVPGGTCYRTVQPPAARRSAGAVVSDGSEPARRRRPLRDARRRDQQHRADDLHRGERDPDRPRRGDDRALRVARARASS